MGQSPELGFDCSGFVKFVLQSSGLTIPDYIGQDGIRRPVRHANEFWDSYGIAVHEGLTQQGDLIFFSRNGKFPTHIAILLDDQNYVHAPGIDNSFVERKTFANEQIVSSTDEELIYNRNPIGFKAPTQTLERPTYRYHQMAI